MQGGSLSGGCGSVGGGGGGGSTAGSQHTRTGSVRGAPRQPMPDTQELERRFTKVLVSRKFIVRSWYSSFYLLLMPFYIYIYIGRGGGEIVCDRGMRTAVWFVLIFFGGVECAQVNLR